METKLNNGRSVCEGDTEEAETLLDSDKTIKIMQQNGKSTSQNDTSQGFNPKYTVPLVLKTARASLYVLIKALNIVYVPVFIYRVFQKSKKCSPVKDPILRIPASELAEKIRRKEISCEQVIQSYITRIKEVNPMLNAVIENRFDEALEDAKRVDRLVSSEDFSEDEQKYPLLGVPVTIKGSIAVKGMKYTSGSVTRKAHRAESDAEAVDLVRKAGAIPLLVTNVPEFCMSWETSNKLIGTTKNPHDTTRTCGGSSGGEASLLAAGASLIGIGSDIAGSLRLPAHYCGVWGHKPTPGAVSFEGHYPSCPQRDKWEAVFTIGPMARYATDLRILLDAISVPENRQRLDLNHRVDVKNIKIYYSEHEDYYWQKPNRHCTGAVNKVVDYFSKMCDTTPKEVDFYLSLHAPDLACLDLLTLEDIEGTFNGNENGALAELFRYTTFRSRYSFMVIACGLLQKLTTGLKDKQKNGIKKFLAKMRKEYEDLLGSDGVFIVPSFPIEAPKHGDVLRTAIYAGYMGMFNALGFPVTNCPIGVTEDGLPVGVQVVSSPYGDKLTLSVAEEIERAFGGWVEPHTPKKSP